jgi:hypothetical protein
MTLLGARLCGPINWRGTNPLLCSKFFAGALCAFLFVASASSIWKWPELRGVYDDICYLRQPTCFSALDSPAGWRFVAFSIVAADPHGENRSPCRDGGGALAAPQFISW